MMNVSFTSGQILDIIDALEEKENALYDADHIHLATYYMNMVAQFQRIYDSLQDLPGEKRVANFIPASNLSF